MKGLLISTLRVPVTIINGKDTIRLGPNQKVKVQDTKLGPLPAGVVFVPQGPIEEAPVAPTKGTSKATKDSGK